jgi:pyruvate/2-oxoglutarate/acetoin dehydrogenase E1 component
LQEGKQVTVVAVALMAQRVFAVARQLAEEGFSVEVIDPRTVMPLDTDTIIESVKKTGRLMIVEETFAYCSLGAEIAAQVASEGFDFLDAPIRRINGAFAPTPYSPTLEAAVAPSMEGIATEIRRLIQE